MVDRMRFAALMDVGRMRLVLGGVTLLLAAPLEADQLTVQTQAAEHTLAAAVEKQSLDGAVCTQVCFTRGERAFRYTPPAGWKVRASSGQVVLSRGKVTAQLFITVKGGSRNSTEASAEELKQFQQETAARAPASRAATLSVFPFKVGNLIVVESSASYVAGGRPQVLHRIRTFGGDWKIQAEITGPQEDVAQLDAQIAQSLCSLEVQTRQDVRNEAARREASVLAKLATVEQEHHASRRPVRGRLLSQ